MVWFFIYKGYVYYLNKCGTFELVKKFYTTKKEKVSVW